MKYSLLAFILLFISSTYAQDVANQSPQSAIEEFSSQDGILIQKDYIDVGEFKGCEIQVAVITNLMSSEIKKGVRFSYEVKKSYGSDTKIAYLDTDEVDALIKSVEIIKSDVLTTTKQNYTEVEFTSRGGYKARCFYSKSAWSGFLKIEKFDEDSYVWFKASDFEKLLILLKRAITNIINE